jgi:NADH-quinone oxidoreductase subunit N
MSLSVYAMVGLARQDRRSAEGAMKYFVLGSFSSAFLLYGLALLYGATGTIYLDRMQDASAAAEAGGAAATTLFGNRLVLVAVALLFVGFGFKVGAVPFHAWVPDAYQGAPAAVTGFMAVAVKAAAFGVLFRVLYATHVLEMPGGVGTTVLWILAALTMVLGNVAALTQSNLKRLLAYSGIAHSGYVLTGIAAAGGRDGAAAASLFYLIGYAAMTAGAFAVLTLLRREGRDIEDVDDLGGLAYERPGAALAMTIFMVSLVGVPPTAGFMGKLWVFKEAIQAGYVGLVIVAILTTVVSIYYYLRVVVVMYMEERPEPVPVAVPAPAPEREPHRGPPSQWGGSFAVAVAAIATVLIGLAPSGLYGAALRSIQAIANGTP